MNRFRQTGVSLIELMVTVGVIAILATLAAPSLQSMIERNQVQALTNNMLSNLYYARSEAAKRSFNVVLCASNAAQDQCNAQATNFANGWIIFTDYDNNLQLTDQTTLFDTDGNGLTDSPEQVLLVGDAPNARFNVTSNGSPSTSVSYRPTGITSPRAFSFIIANQDGSQSLSRISVNNTGRVRSCSVKPGETDC